MKTTSLVSPWTPTNLSAERVTIPNTSSAGDMFNNSPVRLVFGASLPPYPCLEMRNSTQPERRYKRASTSLSIFGRNIPAPHELDLGLPQRENSPSQELRLSRFQACANRFCGESFPLCTSTRESTPDVLRVFSSEYGQAFMGLVRTSD